MATQLERYVTKVSWLKLREPFRQVWSGEAKRIDVPASETGAKVKIYRVGNMVRIDVDDPGWIEHRLDMLAEGKG